jgi:uncharacterized membrane protein
MSVMARLPLSCLLPGAVFFAASLTPSLLPRPFVLQGVLSGLSFAAGYGLGAAATALWHYLQLPVLPARAARVSWHVATALCLLVVTVSLWQAANWQNSVRRLMGMEEQPGAQPLLLLGIAALTFFLVLGPARLFRWFSARVSRRLDRHVPPRVSRALAVAATLLLFGLAIDGALSGFALRVVDRSFRELDALIDDDLPVPQSAAQTGSAASLVDWEDLGRQGRRFVAGGPDAGDLGEFFGAPMPAPVRVYVGLNSADSPAARARLALDELKRAGGFDRALLVLVTPTGTGWVDPGSLDTLEYLLRGDVASVAVQYSYLNSPLALLTEAAYGAETARAVFHEIYSHWRSLPAGSRPRLYLNGLSLGSLHSDLSFDFFDIIDDPFDGALWSGPPFRHETWRQVTDQREPGSPPWRPEFRRGAVVRFMNQDGAQGAGPAPWGKFRLVFLQYPSDPITFFSPGAAWRTPDWMRQPRGPDVSPGLRWFPVVTMLQLAADMVVGTAPPGFGHNFAPSDYIDAWLALTEPPGWSEPELARLRAIFLETEEMVGSQ